MTLSHSIGLTCWSRVASMPSSAIAPERRVRVIPAGTTLRRGIAPSLSLGPGRSSSARDTRRCQSQGETARPAQGGLGNIQARRQGARHPGAVGQGCLQGLDRQVWTSPAPPSTTSSRPARSLRADPKARTALMLYFNTNVGATLDSRTVGLVSDAADSP